MIECGDNQSSCLSEKSLRVLKDFAGASNKIQGAETSKPDPKDVSTEPSVVTTNKPDPIKKAAAPDSL